MGYFIEQALMITYGIIVVLIIFAIILFIWMYFNKKKRRIRVNDDIDDSGFDRKDAKEYLPFDTIKDNMIITDNGKRFVGVIKCQGFDYYNASIAQRDKAISSYIGFLSSLKIPITYRQHTRSSSLAPTVEMYEKAHEGVLEELYNLADNYHYLAEKLEEIHGSDMKKENALLDELERLQKKIKSLAWREYHLRDQMGYINRMSNHVSMPERVEAYVFDWVYDPTQYMRDLTDEEIYQKAIVELQQQANNFIYSLSNAGVKAERMLTNELIDMNRVHMRPLTADNFRMPMVENTSMYEDIITSHSHEKVRAEWLEDLQMELKKNAAEMIIGYSDALKQEMNNLQKEKLVEEKAKVLKYEKDNAVSFSKKETLDEKEKAV